jgi:hypothetical protein
MLPDAAVTVTVDVPGVTGGVTVEVLDEPHPARVSTIISKEKDPKQIAADLRPFIRQLTTGIRPANPKGKRPLATSMRFVKGPCNVVE